MEITDARLTDNERELLARAIGGRLEKFRCEAYNAKIRAAAWGILGLFIDGRVIAIERQQKMLLWHGEMGEVAVTQVHEAAPEDIICRLIGSRTVDHPVWSVIRDILLYEDSEYKFRDGVDLDRFDMTTAIVLQLDHTQLVLRFTPIMELIDIYRGPNTENRIPRVDENDDEYREEFRVERTIVSLKDWAAEHGL